ncbi:unnamed protein product, partial [Vitis vinifera]|uniref:Uncharacterized protein n=1 Tax=Vitis vinifera TaxID=29760 RepID=D7T1X1_VITVI
MSTVAISTAVPVQKTSLNEDSNDQPESPSSPASETNSSTSTYATGTTSLVGSSFLDCLFPLFPPNSGFLAKVGCPEGSPPPPELQNKGLDRETNSSVIVRRAPTLGELIMKSRRRSYRRKAVQMRKHNLSVGFTKKRAFGCWIFGTGGSRIGGLLGKKRQPRLKLV